MGPGNEVVFLDANLAGYRHIDISLGVLLPDGSFKDMDYVIFTLSVDDVRELIVREKSLSLVGHVLDEGD